MKKPQKRTHLSLEGRYETNEKHELVRSTYGWIVSQVADGCFINLSHEFTANLWLTFTHGKPGEQGFDIIHTTEHFNVWGIVDPFNGKPVEQRKRELYELVDSALKAGFWNGKESPLSEADTIQIRDEFYKKIEEYPVLN